MRVLSQLSQLVLYALQMLSLEFFHGVSASDVVLKTGGEEELVAGKLS